MSQLVVATNTWKNILQLYLKFRRTELGEKIEGAIIGMVVTTVVDQVITWMTHAAGPTISSDQQLIQQVRPAPVPGTVSVVVLPGSDNIAVTSDSVMVKVPGGRFLGETLMKTYSGAASGGSVAQGLSYVPGVVEELALSIIAETDRTVSRGGTSIAYYLAAGVGCSSLEAAALSDIAFGSFNSADCLMVIEDYLSRAAADLIEKLAQVAPNRVSWDPAFALKFGRRIFTSEQRMRLLSEDQKEVMASSPSAISARRFAKDTSRHRIFEIKFRGQDGILYNETGLLNEKRVRLQPVDIFGEPLINRKITIIKFLAPMGVGYTYMLMVPWWSDTVRKNSGDTTSVPGLIGDVTTMITTMQTVAKNVWQSDLTVTIDGSDLEGVIVAVLEGRRDSTNAAAVLQRALVSSGVPELIAEKFAEASGMVGSNALITKTIGGQYVKKFFNEGANSVLTDQFSGQGSTTWPI